MILEVSKDICMYLWDIQSNIDQSWKNSIEEEDWKVLLKHLNHYISTSSNMFKILDIVSKFSWALELFLTLFFLQTYS